MTVDDKALEAAYAAVDQLPLRDFEHIGGELDKRRSHEGARAAVTAYLSALPSKGGEAEPLGYIRKDALMALGAGARFWDTTITSDPDADERTAVPIYAHPVAAPAPAGTKPQPSEERGWLLERADSDTASPWYWAAGQIDPSRSSAWTQNHMAAIRFARREDAQAVADRLMRKVPVAVRVCEHEWSPHQPADDSQWPPLAAAPRQRING